MLSLLLSDGGGYTAWVLPMRNSQPSCQGRYGARGRMMEMSLWGCHRRDPSILPEREESPRRGRSIQFRPWRMFKSWMVREGKGRCLKQMGELPSRLTEANMRNYTHGKERYVCVVQVSSVKTSGSLVFSSTGHGIGSNILSKEWWSEVSGLR